MDQLSKQCVKVGIRCLLWNLKSLTRHVQIQVLYLRLSKVFDEIIVYLKSTQGIYEKISQQKKILNNL
jgi:hypothetical protein